MKATNVQGTTVFIANVPTPMWADCTEVSAGLIAGVEAMCPQSLGELTRTRATTENACVSSNDSVKSAGKLSYGDFTMELLLDNEDIAGQDALLTAFDNNKPIMLGLVSVDGDIIFTEGLVAGDGIAYPADGLIGYSSTISPYGGFHRCSATAIVPKDCALSIGNLAADEFNLSGFLYRNCNIFKA